VGDSDKYLLFRSALKIEATIPKRTGSCFKKDILQLQTGDQQKTSRFKWCYNFSS